jgi:hypothetical protein
MNKRLLMIVIAGVFFIALSGNVIYAFEGTPTLVCAALEAVECTAGADCQRGMPTSVNFPRFMKIDFQKKVIIDDQFGEEIRRTPFEKIQEVDEKLILHGTQEGMGWSLVVSRTNGDLSLSAINNDFGFMIFGACTPQ